jgi:hypothetical protein
MRQTPKESSHKLPICPRSFNGNPIESDFIRKLKRETQSPTACR